EVKKISSSNSSQATREDLLESGMADPFSLPLLSSPDDFIISISQLSHTPALFGFELWSCFIFQDLGWWVLSFVWDSIKRSLPMLGGIKLLIFNSIIQKQHCFK
ncbi:hypothetical protein PanWU01x14_200590, partial [Parasponia andersonii]